MRYASTGIERAGLLVTGLAALGLLVLALLALYRRLRRSEDSAPAAPTRLASLPAPPSWLLLSLTALLVVKFAVIDPYTTLFRCVSTAERVCGAQSTVDVPFDNGIHLRGYRIFTPGTAAGGEVHLQLYWQTAELLDRSWHSFVHIRNSEPNGPMNPRTGGEIWAQEEHTAPGGLLATDFLPGKLYEEEFRFTLPTDIPPATYFLEIGWFDPQTGEQVDLDPNAVPPPLRILWRSLLLPSLRVGS